MALPLLALLDRPSRSSLDLSKRPAMTRKLDDHMTAANMFDKETLRSMVNAVPVRDIVKDHLGKPTSLPGVVGSTPKVRGENIREALPLEAVPNIALADAIAESFARRDRIALARELGVALPKEDLK